MSWIVFRSMPQPQNLTYEKSILAQVKAWYVDPDLYHHTASLGHNDLMMHYVLLSHSIYCQVCQNKSLPFANGLAIRETKDVSNTHYTCSATDILCYCCLKGQASRVSTSYKQFDNKIFTTLLCFFLLVMIRFSIHSIFAWHISHILHVCFTRILVISQC